MSSEIQSSCSPEDLLEILVRMPDEDVDRIPNTLSPESVHALFETAMKYFLDLFVESFDPALLFRNAFSGKGCDPE